MRRYHTIHQQFELNEGEYGINPHDNKWYCCPPGWDSRYLGCLSNHQIIQHNDGTITVSPSILITAIDGAKTYQWHGYLIEGKWKTA